jgi:hypothetical protein
MKDRFNSGERDGMLVYLEACLIQMDASKEWFARRVLPLSLDQLRWRPNLGGWSIAECLDHLNTTLALYLPKLDDAIGRGRWEAGTLQGPSRLGQSESEFLKRFEPPATIRIPAPPAVAPSASVDPDCLVDRFHNTRDRYVDAVRRASGLDLARILITEPIHATIRSLGGALALIAAHDRRHMWQAEQVRQTPGFPRSVLQHQEGNGGSVLSLIEHRSVSNDR